MIDLQVAGFANPEGVEFLVSVLALCSKLIPALAVVAVAAHPVRVVLSIDVVATRDAQRHVATPFFS